MSDMFDTYNRVRANGLSQALKRNGAEAQAIINEVAAERDEALRDVDVWRSHYVGEKARADYLMELLDEKCGGAEFNPAREVASDSIRIPRGEREGQLIQKHDRIYLTAMKNYIAEKVAYVGNWKSLISEYRIFQ